MYIKGICITGEMLNVRHPKIVSFVFFLGRFAKVCVCVCGEFRIRNTLKREYAHIARSFDWHPPTPLRWHDGSVRRDQRD